MIQQQAHAEVYAWLENDRRGPAPIPPQEYSNEQREVWWAGYHSAIIKFAEEDERKWMWKENSIVVGIKIAILLFAVGTVVLSTSPAIQVGAGLIGLYTLVKWR